MSDVLFGQGYHLRFDPKLWGAMEPYPPLGALYAAAVLRDAGFSVAFHDSMLAVSEDEWAEALDREGPRFAVIYEDNFNYLTKMCLLRMREAACTMIAMARERGVEVVVAGSDASDNPGIYLERGARVVLCGEGEASLVEVMDRLAGRVPGELAEVAGIALADPDRPGGLRRTPARTPIRDLDALPPPAWDLVDLARYREIWLARHGRFSLNMVTTRGCPYHCNWCAKPLWGQRYAVRSPRAVADELGRLVREHEVEHVWFMDDIFGLKPSWLPELADLVEERRLAVRFKCLSRPDLMLREGTVEALARAGCEIVWMGAESGSQTILDAMEKGTTVEQIAAAADRLHSAGVKVAFFVQFGYPGETRADVEATLQMIRDCRPDDVGMSVSYPLPGTPFHERVQAELGDKRHWVDSNDLDMMYRGPFTTDFYRQLHTVLHTELRARRRGRELAGLAARPWRLRPRHAVEAAGVLARWARLPFERRRLDRLARLPHRGIGPLPPGMSHAEAARPSPQSD
ncbi:MAG: B12-binding domain-containing radical SAM protein [Thermoanaerobaculales bacterium]|jgi:anaerobic magnesium-protoporphyrin IX monomethyl ester cyclase|nr:B12-binding domain-containing radical SAM protein [Thermoanaerobaculales bacterium]